MVIVRFHHYRQRALLGEMYRKSFPGKRDMRFSVSTIASQIGWRDLHGKVVVVRNTL